MNDRVEEKWPGCQIRAPTAVGVGERKKNQSQLSEMDVFRVLLEEGKKKPPSSQIPRLRHVGEV
jgi:hypothetical protein